MSPGEVKVPEWVETPMEGDAYKASILLGQWSLRLVKRVYPERYEWSAYFGAFVADLGMNPASVEDAKRLALLTFGNHIRVILDDVEAAQEALS